MGGVAVIWSYHYAGLEVDPEELGTILKVLSSRGADQQGAWFSNEGNISLGYRGLSVSNGSETDQPLRDDESGIVVSFDGRIYNHQVLRKQLEKRGVRFCSQSDAEVLLMLYREDGLGGFRKLRGMYAAAIWDPREEALHLVRDPFGVKPLYYSDDGWAVRAASQVKGLLVARSVRRTLDPAGLAGYQLLGSIPEPHTLFKDIHAVPAGHAIRIDGCGVHQPQPVMPLADIYANAASRTQEGLGMYMESQDVLCESLKNHLPPDAPAGLLLTGSVESTLLGKLCDGYGQMAHGITLAYDKGGPAIDRRCGTLAGGSWNIEIPQHVEYITKRDFLDHFDAFIASMDQPSIGGTNIWFAARAARRLGLKVILSELGAMQVSGDCSVYGDSPGWHSTRRFIKFSRLAWLVGSIMKPLLGLRATRTRIFRLLQQGNTWAGWYLVGRETCLGRNWLPYADVDLNEGHRRLQIRKQISNTVRGLEWCPRAMVSLIGLTIHVRNQLLRDADWSGLSQGVEIRTPYLDVHLASYLAEHLPCRVDSTGTTHWQEVLESALGMRLDHTERKDSSPPIWAWLDDLEYEYGNGLNGGSEPQSQKRERWMERWGRIVFDSYLQAL